MKLRFNLSTVFFRVLYIALMAALSFSFLPLTSCKRHTLIRETGEQGVAGQDGADGVDGLSGIGFDFVRDLDGSQLTSDYWIGDASLVVPSSVLDAMPADEDHEGVILYLGEALDFHRYYLLAMQEGSYVIIDRSEQEILGQLEFVADGYLVLVEVSSLDLGSPESGVIVELQEPVIIDAKRTELRVGSVRVRMYGRGD